MKVRLKEIGVEIKPHVGPVDLHWVIYSNGQCLGEVRKMYGAVGRGNDGYRYDFYGDYSPGGYENDLAVAVGRVLIGKDNG
jgi:hypothetical protein